MGGRGASSGIINRLSNYKNAVISQRKIGNYLLNPTKSNGKSSFFNEIGYNMKNAKRLEQDIRKGLENNKAMSYHEDKFGNKSFDVNIPLGIGKKVMVTTAWRIDKGSTAPRFITAYPRDKRRKKHV